MTGYNSEYSDHSFQQKRDMPGGFGESPLRLNKKLGQLETWEEDAIRERAGRLAKDAVHVWALPKLPVEVLEAYRPMTEITGYTVEAHPHLLSGKLKQVFEALRKGGACTRSHVTEEFLKLYVAYKAETNFVDVVPQAKRLRLSLNVTFSEINDPRGICRDVTNMGRWGNGDVEVGLASIEELPYVMGLVRQLLEMQMGSVGEN